MTEFLRRHLPSRIVKLDRTDAANRLGEPNKGRWLRLYCTQHQEAWTVQIAGPLGLGSSGAKVGKDFVIANVILTRAEMENLRDSINAHLADV